MADTPTRVLITRPEPAAEAFAIEVMALGYAPVMSPLIAIAPTRAIIPQEPYSAIIMTSANAARALATETYLLRTPVYTVGTVTAATCRAAGFVNVTCGGETVEALVETLAATIHPFPTTLLYACGTRVSHDLPALLRPFGYHAVAVPVYTSADLSLSDEAIRLLCNGEIAWITLLSRHTATVLAREIDSLGDRNWTRGVYLACLSPGIAKEIGRIAWRHVAVAARPTEAALLECLAGRTTDGGNGHAND